MDEFEGYDFGGIRICKKAVHITADQRRFLVIHGDEFDVVVKYRKWLALLGDTAYTFSLYLNTLLTLVRSRLGLPYWSLSQYLKHRVKDAVAFVGTSRILCSKKHEGDSTMGSSAGTYTTRRSGT